MFVGVVVLCPKCSAEQCHHSKRRGLKDHAARWIGLRVWRCRACGLRFYARSVAARYALSVHCRRCGNLDVQRIAREHVTGWKEWPLRLLRAPAYRCAPCRHRFFSLLRYQPIRPLRRPAEPDIEVKSRPA